MFQRCATRPLGMRSLLRLFELLRISQQNKILGRSTRGHSHGKRHLPGFVDEEHVDGARRVFIRPEPGRTSEHVN